MEIQLDLFQESISNATSGSDHRFIIDAHAHLWLKQDAEIETGRIQSLSNGQSFFVDEIRQMMPPYMIDGSNTAEMLLANMNYAQVSAAVITQEYIDGNQNEYLLKVQQKYPDRFLCCALIDARISNFFEESLEAVSLGFRAIKIPAGRLILSKRRVMLNNTEMMRVFNLMEKRGIILSIDLTDGTEQVPEMEEVIAAFPKLKIAIGHFGMVTRKGWKEQIKLARHENVSIESGGITWLFNEEFYPYPSAVKAIKEAAELVGIEKLMWGSDYPRTMTAITYRMSYDFISKSNLLTENDRTLFLGENARKFYGFENLTEMSYIKNMLE
ncbi:MAG: amidohydrolase family protein [Paludibacter sp.]|nr:amidohydrolase family protein [Paludibacter sp.]